MKIFTRDYRMMGCFPPEYNRYFGGMRYCVLDIETTGLDPVRSKICLIAILTETGSGVRITQFLAGNHYEEDLVLAAAMDFIRDEGIRYVITYNGQAFDVPFINRRLEKLGMGSGLRMFDFDLYRFLQRGTDLRGRIGSLSQKSVEAHYGIASDRQDTITGRESVRLFNEYALSGDAVYEKVILTHNREDVLQLLRLMHLCPGDATDFDAAMAIHGFPACNGLLSVRPRLAAGRKLLLMHGDQFDIIQNRNLNDEFCISDDTNLYGDVDWPINAAIFPDEISTISANFSAHTYSYEISVPVGRFGDDYYLDLVAAGVFTKPGKQQDARQFEYRNELFISDPDYVNGFLILNSRTINIAARAIAEMIV